MKRREFIALVGSTAAWSSLARAQSKGPWRLGALLYSNPQSDPQMAAIGRRLGELGYVEGRNIAIDMRQVGWIDFQIWQPSSWPFNRM